ncbi:integrase arm-type DNA-binding domain-containing protein [uncultured Parasphingorhabdus sp.]|uniref:tyrosine-type recombinase/integrase n=1 Tax=uncultured Parasphingorhabdus sp. TaxID=2709694 RepID=UPI002AA6D4BF|nr:integrase arm-type DNA-binding domain-containing protein [uncultured Parasphingorhabdus sp.]
MAKLTPLEVQHAKPKSKTAPLKLSDGNGLYLTVRPGGSKQWSLRVVMPNPEGGTGTSREFGLGGADVLKLADAREKAAKWRALAKQGIDPKAQEQQNRQAAAEVQERIGKTFRDVAEEWLDQIETQFKNKKHRQQWRNTLATYAYPTLGKMYPNDISARHIMDAVKPQWTTKRVTMQRVLKRINKVLNFANARQYRDFPAPEAEIMIDLLGKPRPKTKHHAAVSIDAAPETLRKIQDSDQTMGRLALQFAIYTAARASEILFARWSEIDLTKKTWTVPEDRMKKEKEHVVPLSRQALEILDEVMPLKKGDDSYIFPSRGGSSLSNMTMLKAQRVAAKGTTQHGWRSTFRDWAGERTEFKRLIIELALAHGLKDKTEASYHRSNYLEQRRPMMQQWADYLNSNIATVSSLDAAREAKALAG